VEAGPARPARSARATHIVSVTLLLTSTILGVSLLLTSTIVDDEHFFRRTASRHDRSAVASRARARSDARVGDHPAHSRGDERRARGESGIALPRAAAPR